MEKLQQGLNLKKLKITTKDLVRENIENLEKLFPSVITETKDEKGNLIKAVDFELLKQELSGCVVEGDRERYQITWPGKKKAILLANLPINKTLRPIREESADWENTGNPYIEGDNLDALKILQESYFNKVKCIYIDKTVTNIITKIGDAKTGTNELRKLFQTNENIIQRPKPVALIKYILELLNDKNGIILDFFSDSATTAHAVMQLNAEDGGSRKYIMVQLPEPCPENSAAYKAGFKNISEIGKERIRRAAKRIKEDTVADIDYGFRVFKVDSSD